MLTKILIAAALSAALAVLSTPADARAGSRGGAGLRGGGFRSAAVHRGGMRGGVFRGADAGRSVHSSGRTVHAGGLYRHRFHRTRFRRPYWGYGSSCWRWRPTPGGWRQVNVCGEGWR